MRSVVPQDETYVGLNADLFLSYIWILSTQQFYDKVAKVASSVHPLWVLPPNDVIWKRTMHNMLIIATNHLSMFSVSTRHRDPNWPAPSPRRSSVVTSREGGMATLPLNTLPQFASQSQGRRTHSAVTFNHRRFWSDCQYRRCKKCFVIQTIVTTF